ncbi:MAG: beta-ketoacyl-ACP synthase III [Myxococcota bacterium]|nr:beta-ketoacyl-ACP synthase III [Myxococcota bacterium]
MPLRQLPSTHTALTGSASFAPPHVVTNEQLCAAYNTWARAENARREGTDLPPLDESTPEFIDRASGILRRHYWDAEGILDPNRLCPRIPDRADDALSVQAEMAVRAARGALESAGRAADEIDLVIVGSSALQRPYPALAIEVQAELGASGHAFDISVGCSSGTYGVQLAVDAVRGGTARRALVCTPELPSAYCNFRDRDSHFILGDASAAVVIEPLEDAKGGFEILASRAVSQMSSAVRNNGGFLNRGDEARRDDADKLFYQQGRRVFRDIVHLVPTLVRTQLDALGLAPTDIARYWLHQANARMNTAVLERILGQSPTEGQAPSVLSEYANTAAAGCLIALDAYRDDLEPGDLGVLCAFGAGYTVGSQILRKL